MWQRRKLHVSMCITRNENYSSWELERFEHVQNVLAGLSKYHGWEVHYSNSKELARMTRNDPPIEQEWSIRPKSGVDSWQWDLGRTSVAQLVMYRCKQPAEDDKTSRKHAYISVNSQMTVLWFHYWPTASILHSRFSLICYFDISLVNIPI